MAKEKGKTAEVVEKKAQSSKKARLFAEKKLADMKARLRGIELKLVEAESLNLAYVENIANLKAARRPVRRSGKTKALWMPKTPWSLSSTKLGHGFREGWLATLQAIGVAEESPLRNLEQIPYSVPLSPVQSQAITVDEDTPNKRELVQEIDTHVEMVDLEVTSTLNAAIDVQAQQLQFHQPIQESQIEPVDDAALSQFADPATQD